MNNTLFINERTQKNEPVQNKINNKIVEHQLKNYPFRIVRLITIRCTSLVPS